MTRYRISLEAHEHADESTSERPVLLSRPFCVDVDVDANSPEEATAILGCVLTELVAESRDRFGFVMRDDSEKNVGFRDAQPHTELRFGKNGLELRGVDHAPQMVIRGKMDDD